jgi:hypothetical protein
MLGGPTMKIMGLGGLCREVKGLESLGVPIVGGLDSSRAEQWEAGKVGRRDTEGSMVQPRMWLSQLLPTTTSSLNWPRIGGQVTRMSRALRLEIGANTALSTLDPMNQRGVLTTSGD